MVSVNRDLAASFMVLTVAWVLFGFSITPLEPLQATANAQTQAMIYAMTVLVLVFIPLVMILKPWTALGTVVVGGVNFAVVGVVGVILSPERIWPAINAILSVVFAFFALRAYREKPGS